MCLSSQKLDNNIVIIFVENLRLQEHKRFWSLANWSNNYQLTTTALANSAVGELQDFFCPTQAATHFFRNQNALTDNLFNNLTNKIKNCE